MSEFVPPTESRLSNIDHFVTALAGSCADDSLVRLTLSGPVMPAKGEFVAVTKVLVRLIELKGIPNLSITLREAQRDVTRNLQLEAGLAWVKAQLGVSFRNALLATTRRDWQLGVSGSGEARLFSHRPSTKTAPPRSHDEAKQSFLDASARDWLERLGICDAEGRVRPTTTGKHRQIARYLEIFSHLAADCGWDGAPAAGDTSTITIADMGCGKGALTFGVWHLFHRVWQRPVRVIGVEQRHELSDAANAIAGQINAPNLNFMAGEIAFTSLPQLDALIALHACNTATDDAIRRGIVERARLIVLAPCCHQEVRPQLGQPEPLAGVLRHGIMAERMAEWATDGLRALFLEWAGYQVKTIEFVASEHTPKNLMLAAVKAGEPFHDLAARDRILRFKEFFGIGNLALDPLLEAPST